MAARNWAVYAIYADRATANDAVEALRQAGFRTTDISILLPDNVGSKDFAHEKHTKAPEGAVAGGSAGGAVGAALGWLSGAGALMLPGMEQFAHVGPLVATFGGLGAGAMLGGITGALVGLGRPEYEAKRYMGRIRRGGILLSVHCDDPAWVQIAKKTLKRSGGLDIGSRAEAKADFAHADKPLPRSNAPAR